eukprot:CAMPEP_0174694302 /NCGR_PEP_ID=MMETSP1094-20130205/919_1 /TAXON_ID=156173 /ORGANISM="Chrysochromulina brevifilum, Strain UTEX LB 985" /LENGTH=50 /DNA_ID=CAMNT_0015890505 /DNA_START=71 /DNA_END=220 /DNA_ORIENTATION=+
MRQGQSAQLCGGQLCGGLPCDRMVWAWACGLGSGPLSDHEFGSAGSSCMT